MMATTKITADLPAQSSHVAFIRTLIAMTKLLFDEHQMKRMNGSSIALTETVRVMMSIEDIADGGF